jgi:hypothetical protein
MKPRPLHMLQVNTHFARGMSIIYTVAPSATHVPTPLPATSPVRQYFVASELVEWNYAPAGEDETTPGWLMSTAIEYCRKPCTVSVVKYRFNVL